MEASDDVRTLAHLVKSKARQVERSAHELRRLAAQLEDAAAASDTSTKEETDVSEANRSHAHA